MLQGPRAAHRSDDGFTLVELQVVLAILGVLSGAAFYATRDFRDEAVEIACRGEARAVETASVAYHANNGRFASAIDDAAHTATTLVGAGYLTGPPDGAEYTITYDATNGLVRGTVGTKPCG